jgi:hypothetical protein
MFVAQPFRRLRLFAKATSVVGSILYFIGSILLFLLLLVERRGFC